MYIQEIDERSFSRFSVLHNSSLQLVHFLTDIVVPVKIFVNSPLDLEKFDFV